MGAAGDRAARTDAAEAKIVVPRAGDSRVAIAVPTFRQPERLSRCLRAALDAAAHDGIRAELVIVLDGAESDVDDFVTAGVEGATVLSWPQRRGIAAGLNAAMRATSSPYVVVLQDDARPRPGWLASLLSTASRHPRGGAIGSLCLWPDGTVQSAGAVVAGDGRTMPPWSEPPAPEAFTEVRAVDYVSSSFLVNRDAWSAVGGFDEEMYPALFVDADFCTALWQAGWLVLLDPHAVVVHDQHGSVTTRFRDFVYERNRARFVQKWGSFLAGRPPSTAGAGGIDAAVARAAAWLDSPPPASGPAAAGVPVADAPTVYARRERDALWAYAKHLDERLSALEAAYGSWTALEAHARALEERLAEVEAAPRPPPAPRWRRLARRIRGRVARSG